MSVQSKELTYFYRQYKKWLDNGAPDKKPFHRSVGLCSSLIDVLTFEEIDLIDEELKDQFIFCGLSYVYPFGEDNFDIRMGNNTQHLDPKRIQWVEDHLKPEFTGEN